MAAAEHDLIRPEMAIPEASAVIHRITDDRAATGRPEREVLAELLEALAGRILVAHNAAFDQQFLNRALVRTNVKRSPFHPFSFIDTASLAAVAFGHTVLSEACARAEISFDKDQAHSALYDAERTAELFCAVVNAWEARS